MNKKVFIFECLFVMFLSILFLMICSRSSPLFAMNDWTDVNIYFTGGKLINEGKIIYRDFFDHKGPILYFIFAFITRIAANYYIGLWILEIIVISFFFYYTIQIAKLYVNDTKIIYFTMPVVAMLVLSSVPFCKGGNVEELVLYLLTYSIWYFLNIILFKRKVNVLQHIIIGICIGILFWLKFTLVGFYLGAFAYLIAYSIIRKQREIIKTFIYYIIGFCIVTIPIFLYFIFNNALYEMLYTYFYCNIFVYSDKSSIVTMLKNLIKFLSSAGIYIIPICLGFLIMFFKKENILFFIITGLTVCLVYSTKYMFYYSLVLSIYSFAIIILSEKIYLLLKTKFVFKGRNVLLLVILCILLVSGTIGLNYRDIRFSKYEKNDLPQYKFAHVINSVENSTLLFYGFLDNGFYMTSNKMPINKFYFKPNLTLKEYTEETDEIIRNKLIDFIVINDFMHNEKLKETYTCVGHEKYDSDGNIREYYLYRKNSN